MTNQSHENHHVPQVPHGPYISLHPSTVSEIVPHLHRAPSGNNRPTDDPIAAALAMDTYFVLNSRMVGTVTSLGRSLLIQYGSTDLTPFTTAYYIQHVAGQTTGFIEAKTWSRPAVDFVGKGILMLLNGYDEAISDDVVGQALSARSLQK